MLNPAMTMPNGQIPAMPIQRNPLPVLRYLHRSLAHASSNSGSNASVLVIVRPVLCLYSRRRENLLNPHHGRAVPEALFTDGRTVQRLRRPIREYIRRLYIESILWI